MAQKGSLRVQQISGDRRTRGRVSVYSAYPEFGAHEAGADVPTMPFLHNANADPRLPTHPTAAEAHPARSLCAAYIRGSTYTWPGPICQRCLSFTTPMLISSRRSTQPLLRHIRPGLRVHVALSPYLTFHIVPILLFFSQREYNQINKYWLLTSHNNSSKL